jgi:hypothetical protein
VPTTKDKNMRVMVIVKATQNSEAGVLPSEQQLAAMGQYNEELVKAGILLAGEGLKPSKHGKRILFSGNKRNVVDGPFAETKELIAGYTLIQVKSREEAMEWARRFPNPGNRDGEIEVRQLYDLDDFEEGITSWWPDQAKEAEETLERFRKMGLPSQQ